MQKSEKDLSEEALDALRLEKQSYLRKEIVEVGYDPFIFQNYLDNLKKGGGTNVDQWEMDELIDIVKKYKAKFWMGDVHDERKEGGEEKSKEGTEDDIQDTDNNESETKPVGIPVLEKKLTDSFIESPIIASHEISQHAYSNTILCRKKESLLEGKEFTIKIKGLKIDLGGLFSSKHINYVICTLPLGWEVQRRFSDFNWLRRMLMKLYPQYILPPLPSKKSNQKHDPQNDEKRKRFLENFLTNLIKCDEIRNTKLVVDFLNVVDANVYKIKKKEAEKFNRSNKIELNETLTGRINLLIDKDSINMLNKLPVFLTEVEMTYKKIKKVAKQLIADYKQMSNTLSLLGESFTKLFEITTKINSSIPEKKVP